MPKMIVCGDSYMSPTTTHPNTHFSEIIAQRLGYELVAYSRGGMSNGGIAIQLDTAIRERPDLILLGTTNSDRIEFPINEPRQTEIFTVGDIYYDHATESLSSNVDFFVKNPQLISTNLIEIMSDHFIKTFDKCNDPDIKIHTIKQWFNHLYHPDWKTQTDKWMMYALLHQLHESKIPYIVCHDSLGVVHQCSWIKDTALTSNINIIIEMQQEKYGHVSPYHTSTDAQAEIAELLITYMKETFDV